MNKNKSNFVIVALILIGFAVIFGYESYRLTKGFREGTIIAFAIFKYFRLSLLLIIIANFLICLHFRKQISILKNEIEQLKQKSK